MLDRREVCGGNNAPAMRPESVRYIMIHSHGPVLDGWPRRIVDARSMHAAHSTLDLGTGRCPYHAVVRRGGDIDWAIDWGRKGAHAYQRNREAIGIAVLRPEGGALPTAEQWAALVDLLVYLRRRFPRAEIVRHDAVARASRDPAKVCPAPGFPWRDLLGHVELIYRLEEGENP